MNSALGRPDHATGRKPARGWIWAGRLGALGVLLLIFGAYRQPEMLMQMAQQLWSCFG